MKVALKCKERLVTILKGQYEPFQECFFLKLQPFLLAYTFSANFEGSLSDVQNSKGILDVSSYAPGWCRLNLNVHIFPYCLSQIPKLQSYLMNMRQKGKGIATAWDLCRDCVIKAVVPSSSFIKDIDYQTKIFAFVNQLKHNSDVWNLYWVYWSYFIQY